MTVVLVAVATGGSAHANMALDAVVDHVAGDDDSSGNCSGSGCGGCRGQIRNSCCGAVIVVLLVVRC
jgi:hypothetical protein